MAARRGPSRAAPLPAGGNRPRPARNRGAGPYISCVLQRPDRGMKGSREMNGLDAARTRRNLIERLVAKIPGLATYLEHNLVRDVDKLEREHMAHQLDRARQSLQRQIANWSKGGQLQGLDAASSLDKGLDRLANRIRHADYGAAGLFDAVKIGQAQLEQIYAFDLDYVGTIEAVVGSTESLGATLDAAAIKLVNAAVEAADREFDRRETVYHDAIKGAR